MTDMELAGRLIQVVLAGLTLCTLTLGVRLVIHAARDFHRAGLARLAHAERRTNAGRTDTRRIA